jgi:hypothetical protein
MIKANSNVSVSTEQLEMSGIPIGVPIGVWFDSDPNSVVVKYPSRFIKLSKSSAYNTGKLASQAAVTADETTFYTATISDAGSPLNGQSVTLINSVENTTGGVSSNPSFLAAAETPQVRRANRFQSHRVVLANSNGGSPLGNLLGGSETGWYYNVTPTSSLVVADRGFIDSDGLHGVVRIGKFTEPTSATAIFYMRII